MRSETNCNIRQLRRPSGMHDGRRIRANMPARLKAGTSRVSCQVTDVSSGGACLTLGGPLDEDGMLWLIMNNLPPVLAKAVWRKSNRVGLRFEKDQSWVHQAGEARFNTAAWLEEGSGLN